MVEHSTRTKMHFEICHAIIYQKKTFKSLFVIYNYINRNPEKGNIKKCTNNALNLQIKKVFLTFSL